MTTRTKGDRIVIPTLEELESVGWLWYTDKLGYSNDPIYHPDFKVLNYRMGKEMQKFFGKTVTLIGIDATVEGHHLYGIEEDGEQWRWCFDFFDEMIDKNINTCSSHEEGQTPIFGWLICKHCGTNLKEIR